jgi:hypothetical protein
LYLAGPAITGCGELGYDSRKYQNTSVSGGR